MIIFVLIKKLKWRKERNNLLEYVTYCLKIIYTN